MKIDTPNYLLMSQAIALLCKLLLSITLEIWQTWSFLWSPQEAQGSFRSALQHKCTRSNRHVQWEPEHHERPIPPTEDTEMQKHGFHHSFGVSQTRWGVSWWSLPAFPSANSKGCRCRTPPSAEWGTEEEKGKERWVLDPSTGVLLPLWIKHHILKTSYEEIFWKMAMTF